MIHDVCLVQLYGVHLSTLSTYLSVYLSYLSLYLSLSHSLSLSIYLSISFSLSLSLSFFLSFFLSFRLVALHTSVSFMRLSSFQQTPPLCHGEGRVKGRATQARRAKVISK